MRPSLFKESCASGARRRPRQAPVHDSQTLNNPPRRAIENGSREAACALHFYLVPNTIEKVGYHHLGDPLPQSQSSDTFRFGSHEIDLALVPVFVNDRRRRKGISGRYG